MCMMILPNPDTATRTRRRPREDIVKFPCRLKEKYFGIGASWNNDYRHANANRRCTSLGEAARLL